MGHAYDELMRNYHDREERKRLEKSALEFKEGVGKELEKLKQRAREESK